VEIALDNEKVWRRAIWRERRYPLPAYNVAELMLLVIPAFEPLL
jgi:hypothetical protein